jgi:ubiquinone/menaquinone biosynthesis C-methylase UbiE
VTAGQASPERLGKSVANLLKNKLKHGEIPKKIKIVDVGCGLGANMKLISELMPDAFVSIHGVDWSPATVEFHRAASKSVYSEIQLCDSSRLPYGDNEFDIALSMENLEHLYSDGCIKSLEELRRISKCLVVTTPLPAEVINFGWIYPELVEATLDQVALTNHDYICLESAVHKSTVFPKSMLDAGFSIESDAHGIYFGVSKNLDVGRVAYVAIEPERDEVFDNYKQKYLWLLAKSAQLQSEIASHNLYEVRGASGVKIIHNLKRWIKGELGRKK